MGLGRGIPARGYSDIKCLREWAAGFQPAFTQIKSGYGIGSRDSSPRLRIRQVVTGMGRGIPARGYSDIKCLRNFTSLTGFYLELKYLSLSVILWNFPEILIQFLVKLVKLVNRLFLFYTDRPALQVSIFSHLVVYHYFLYIQLLSKNVVHF